MDSPPPSPLPRLKVSSLALLGIAVIAVVVLVAIYGYILFVTTMAFHSKLWWMGLVSFIFAAIFYLLSAATKDRTIMRSASAAFFLIGAGGFYGSLFLNNDSEFSKLVWLVILSILVVLILVGIVYMARTEERDAARKAQRRLTP